MKIHPQTQQPLPESIVLRCAAQCYETAEFYGARGERGLFDWWSNQGNRIAERLPVYHDIQAARVAVGEPRIDVGYALVGNRRANVAYFGFVPIAGMPARRRSICVGRSKMDQSGQVCGDQARIASWTSPQCCCANDEQPLIGP